MVPRSTLFNLLGPFELMDRFNFENAFTRIFNANFSLRVIFIHDTVSIFRDFLRDSNTANPREFTVPY